MIKRKQRSGKLVRQVKFTPHSIEPFESLAPNEQNRRLQRLAELVVERWNCSSDHVTLVQHEDNAVFHVATDTAEYALRIGAARGFTAAQQRAEMRWLAELREEDLNVPLPCLTAEGDSVVELGLPGLLASRPCVLLRWLPGAPPDLDVDEATTSAVGALTARLHRHGAAFASGAGGTDVGRPEYTLDALFGQCSVFANDGLVERSFVESEYEVVTRAIRLLLVRIPNHRTSFGRMPFIHGDLHRDNVLISGSSVSLIDFDDCGTGSPLLDLAALVESFCRRLARTQAERERLRGALIEGYDRIQTLPADIDARLRDYTIVRLLIILGFVVDSANPAVKSWGPDRIRQILGELRAYCSTE